MSMTSQTEQSEKELAIVVLTEDGTIVDAHDGCKDSLGWDRENLAGQDIGALIPAHRGLLISGILQSADSQAQLGEEASFSMRIQAQRMDQSSFPARLVVRRFGETDCWSASFYPTAPLTPPDPHATGSPEESFSQMQYTPLEETLEAETTEPSAFSDAGDPSPIFTDEALEEPLLSELPPPPSLEASEPENEVSPAEVSFHPPNVEAAPVESAPRNNPSPITNNRSNLAPEDRHLLEERVASLTSQLSSLHSELRQHLEVQTRTENKLNTFEEQLQETKKSLVRATDDLSRQQAQAASGELEAARTLNKALEEHLALHKSANQALQRASAEAERQLAAINAELNQTRAALAQETAKRQDLERKLTALDQDHSAQERKTKLEICRLEAALKAKELELKQLELVRSQKPREQA
jgi:hypothetical protein